MPEPKVVSVSEFKATCLRLFDEVRRSREPILVTRRGEPIALVSPPPVASVSDSWLGSMRDSADISGDIIEPELSPDDWERGARQGWERAEQDAAG